jgi:hypothetical protein
MYSDTKITRSVADAVEKILNPQPIAEELKGGQKKLDKNHNGKLDGQDFKILRKEEELQDEEVEQIDEVKMSDLPSRKVQGSSYGSSKPQPHPFDMAKGPKDKDLKDIESEKKKKKFSEMVNLYQEKGLKALSEMTIKEEPDSAQFAAELADTKAKADGKKKQAEIAKPLEVATRNEEVEIVEYPLDVDAINGVQSETIEERSLTADETKKKEEIVKSMKKGMAGFKERYGDRAKSVMYATATKNAKGD